MPASKRQSQKFLVILNIGHILVGILSLILAFVQFSSFGLDNTAFIDFRFLNTAHVVTGGVGAHMIAKGFGSVVAKCMYMISLTLALWTLAFYADTLAQESSQFESLRELRKMEGGEELINDEVVRYHGGKLAVCSVMILLAVAEIALSSVSLVVLERLASDTYSNLKGIRSGSQKSISMKEINRKRQMAFVALMKIFFSLTVVGLGAYLESIYKRKTAFMKIGWQELTGAIVFASACVDLHALYGKSHNLLNLKVSLVLSIVSAVLALKTLDYSMANYFVIDVREYSRYDELKTQLQETAENGVQLHTDATKKDAFVKFVIHASVIGSLALLFAHSVISAVEASSYIEWKSGKNKSGSAGIGISVLDSSRILGPNGIRYASNLGGRFDNDGEEDTFDYDETLHRQKACAGTVQCVWGLALIALCVISMVMWDFSAGYDGGAGVLWLGCLFIASGLVNANRPNTFTTSVYVLSVVSLVLALERAAYSINVIYQAVSNPRFKDELDPIASDPVKQRSNYNTHIGRITLYSIEAGILVLEFFTATWTALKVSAAIKSSPCPSFSTEGASPLKGPLCSLGFFHLLYAFITISVSIAAEIALWAYNVNVSYLVYMTNGIVVLAAVFVQWTASQRPQFLLSCAILNSITAAVSFFLMAPAARDLYTLVANYRAVYEGKKMTTVVDGQNADLLDAQSKEKSIQEWIIGINALLLLLAISEFVVSVVTGMICSYLLHHAFDPTTSDLRFSTLRSQAPPSHYWSPTGGAPIQPPSILTSKMDNGHQNGRMSRGHSQSSLTVTGDVMLSSVPSGGSKRTLVERVPERYFGGTNDFRLYSRQNGSHTNNERSHTGLRRTDQNGHSNTRHTVVYGGHYGTAGKVNGHGAGRGNGYSNGSYVTTYT